MAKITQSNNFSRPLVSPPLGFKLIAVRQIGNGKNWKVTYSASDGRARESSFRINKKVRECLINNCKWVIDWSYETAQIYEITFKNQQPYNGVLVNTDNYKAYTYVNGKR